MLSIEKAPENVLALKLSGTIEKPDIVRIEEAIKAKLAAHDRVGMVVDMSACHDMTGDAIVEDIKTELGMIDQWQRFPRIALVSDKQFLKALTGFVDPLLPGIDFGHFDANDYEGALAFASQVPNTSDGATRH